MVCPWRGKVTLVAFVWFFSTVCLQMCPQIACPIGCIVTLVAFVWLFSAVRFQIFYPFLWTIVKEKTWSLLCCWPLPKWFLQTEGMNGCIVTLVAFVWFFSTVHFQMFPQITCMRRCIVTLVAFVWIFSNVRFQMCPQIVCMRGCITTQAAFV